MGMSYTFLIFDRYNDYGTKSEARLKSIGFFKRKYELSIKKPLPPKEENLIDILATNLTQKIKQKSLSHKSLVTSKDNYPMESSQDVCRKNFDLERHFNEADYIIPQQVMKAFKNGKKTIKIICTDTDVLVLLCNMYVAKSWWDAEVYMQGFNSDTTVISIKKTTENKDIILSLTAAYSLSGCDTVPKMFRIGKGKTFSVVKRCLVNFLGRADLVDGYIQEGKQFVAQCFKMK